LLPLSEATLPEDRSANSPAYYAAIGAARSGDGGERHPSPQRPDPARLAPMTAALFISALLDGAPRRSGAI